MTDEQLAQQIIDGDLEAFGELYERYKKGIFNFALRFLLDKYLAEDVAHDVFISMSNHAYQYDAGKGKFSTWLYSITYHECCRVKKRNKRFFFTGDDEDSVIERELMKDKSNFDYNDALDLDRALHRIPEKYRLPIVLTKLNGLTSAECASALGISETNVKQRVFRAFKMLKEYYKI